MVNAGAFGDERNGRTLAQAVVDTIPDPFLVLDGQLRVVALSRSFCQMFGVTREEAEGRPFQELDSGHWNIAELCRRLEALIPQATTLDDYEVEHDFPIIGRRVMVLNARKVEIDRNGTEVLVSMQDVTTRRRAEREREELLRQKDVLLEEIKHRVHNSLQIIASILLLKARSVQSEETRRHLQDAHQRVISVAGIQNHLMIAGVSGYQVEVSSYLAKLCYSLAESMVVETHPIKVEVHAEPGSIGSAQAVSLGLITTELVINALKHAFPDRAAGRIVVTFARSGGNWTLSISDDGAGRPAPVADGDIGGLGTKIVEALTGQLGGEVKSASGPGGTTVSVVFPAQPSS